MSEKTLRCTPCRAEFTDEDAGEEGSCPSCGSSAVPMLISEDQHVRLNTHEIRLLSVWASNWVAEQGGPELNPALEGILAHLRCQLPGLPLTLAEEYQAVADQNGAEVTILGLDGEVERYLPRQPPN